MFINKKIILTTIFLSMSSFSFGMNAPTALAKFSPYYRSMMTYLADFALGIGSYSFIQNIINEDNLATHTITFFPADQNSQQFVKNTLCEYNFPPKVINNISIYKYDQFAAHRNMMSIPFNDEKLAIAQYLAHSQSIFDKFHHYQFCKNHNSFNKGYTFDGAHDKDQFVGKTGHTYQIPEHLIIPTLSAQGKYIDKDSLSLWKSAISHEAGHNISNKSIYALAVWPFIGGLFLTRTSVYMSTHLLHKLMMKHTAYNKFIKNKLQVSGQNYLVGTGQVPANSLSFVGGIIGLLGAFKYEEYNADTTMLNHVTDPHVLRKNAELMNAFQAFQEHQISKTSPKLASLFAKYPILYELIDTHPRGSTRAARAIKRAEELEVAAQQQQKK